MQGRSNIIFRSSHPNKSSTSHRWSFLPPSAPANPSSPHYHTMSRRSIMVQQSRPLQGMTPMPTPSPWGSTARLARIHMQRSTPPRLSTALCAAGSSTRNVSGSRGSRVSVRRQYAAGSSSSGKRQSKTDETARRYSNELKAKTTGLQRSRISTLCHMTQNSYT